MAQGGRGADADPPIDPRAALPQLTYFWPTAIGGRRPDIQAHKAPLVGAAARRLPGGEDAVAHRRQRADHGRQHELVVLAARVRGLERGQRVGGDVFGAAVEVATATLLVVLASGAWR